MSIAGIILAGGLSTRMGSIDKCLLELGGKTLIQHAIDRLQSQVDHLAINTNSQDLNYGAYEIPIVPDSVTGFAGPLAGILAGMEWADKQGADKLLSVAADTPFFPYDLRDKLEKTLTDNKHKIAMAQTPNISKRLARHPTFGLWPVDLKIDLRQALDQGIRKVVAWAEPHGLTTACFDNSRFDPFFNVNTPEDYRKAQEIQKEYAS